MSKRKTINVILATVLALSVLLTGCASDNGNGSGSADQPSEQTGDTPQATVTTDDPIEVVFGHGFGFDTPHHRAAEAFKEQVEEQSGGRLTVSLYHSNQLGTARELFEALQIESCHVTTIPTARISGFAPQLQIFDLPFLFPSNESRIEIQEGPIGQELLDTLSDQKVIGVAFYDDGVKQMTANKELRTLEDFKGVKFRTMESDIIMEQYRALGAEPVPVEYAELYNALQMRVVDGQENPINHIHDNKLFEVQSHLMITDHASLSGVFLFSQSWFNALPEDLQEILDKAAHDFIINQREGLAAVQEEYLQNMLDYGMTLVELTDDEIAAFAEATLPVHKIYSDEFGTEILDKIYAATGQ